MPEANHLRTIEIPWRTILKVLAAGVLVWMWLQLYQLVLVLIVAVLLAVTLNPIVKWFERRGLPRWAGATILSAALLVLIGGFLWMTWSALIDQARYATQHLEQFERQVRGMLPKWARGAVAPTGQDVESTLGPYALRFFHSAVSALVVTSLGFILTAYLLIEARRTHDWLLAFVPHPRRAKAEKTLGECETVVFAYVAGNVATSILAFLFVLVLLWTLDVPAALLLALLAGVFDFVPVIGFICSSVPAVVLASTVSGGTAILVLVLYGSYHLVENYFISPWVYGDRLKLSNVAVILAFAVGAELAGVIGALIALPLAAVYPAIERIWLRDELPPETVKEHRAIEKKSA
jgi:predicted PurR-regulated permease PerM